MRTLLVIALLAVGTSASAATYVVSSSNDAGPGSLSAAILDANANPGRDSIIFTTPSISGALFPSITDPVDIDGRVSGGANVFLTSSFAGTGVALTFAAGSGTSTVEFVSFRNYSEAIHVATGVNDVRITRNDAFGGGDVTISGTRTIVGTVGAGNVLGRVFVRGTDNVVQGNNAGTIEGLSGTNQLFADNTVNGIYLNNNGSAVVERNDAGALGINAFLSTPGSVITIRDNTVRAGAGPAIDVGVAVVALIQRNLVTSNGVGIRIFGNSARLDANRISGGTIAIDLAGDGPTPNDPVPDADTGANNLQNFPVLTAARRSPGGIVITGTLASAPSTPYEIQFFSSPASDPKAHVFLGSTNATTDSTGNVSFQALFTTNVPAAGQVITATATNIGTTTSPGNAPNETSELSAAIVVMDTAGADIPTLPIPVLLAVALAIAALGVLKR